MSEHVSVGELIDLNSPVAWHTKPKVFTPLIPAPANHNIMPFSPIYSNPFDVAAAQTNTPSDQNDPFELMFSAATCPTTKYEISKKQTDDINKSKTCENPDNKIKCDINIAANQSIGINSSQLSNDVNSGGPHNKACFLSNFSSVVSCPTTPSYSEDGDINDSVFTQDDINFCELAREANKIARLFSESAKRCSQSIIPSDTEDDIMACEPSWLCISSDDEADNLRKNPAMNVRVSYAGMSQSFMEIKKSLEESDALKRFKSKKRQSLGTPTKDDEPSEEVQKDEICLRRSQSLGSKMPAYNTFAHPPTSAPTPARQLPIAFVKPEENITSKLKMKKAAGHVERKPLKAIIPLQNMARNFQQHKERFLSNFRETSPSRKNNVTQSKKQGTPVKKTLSKSPKPVAASTPVPSSRITKRRSVGSKTDNTRRSRPPFPDIGGTRRSSSASSGIPTPISLR